MNNNTINKLTVINLGLTKFKDTWDYQRKLVDLRSQSKISDCLILTEHEPVITLGRAAKKENLLISVKELKERHIALFKVERGGDITFHGPGQIVAYPIIDLTARGRDLHQYLRNLESVIIATLKEYNLKATVRKGLTGVWVENHKLAAIGVAVSKWVSYHGLSLNVDIDLEYFKLINPCGITRFPVGSISSILNKKVRVDDVSKLLVENFAEQFNYKVEHIKDPKSLIVDLATV